MRRPSSFPARVKQERVDVNAGVRDRIWSGIGSAAVMALLGWALVLGLHVDIHRAIEEPLALLDLRTPLPPPPRRPDFHRWAKRAAKPPSPPNLKRQAAEIVKPPPPPIVLPFPPPPVVAAPKAGTGMAASAGNAHRPGPGYGAGGAGNGSGGGGDGGDGDNTPPEQIAGELRASDLPSELWRSITAEAKVSVRYYVNIDGRVTGCRATRSSGIPELDALTCRIIERRFRYDPSRDPDGRPVRSIVEDDQYWGRDRDDADDRN